MTIVGHALMGVCAHRVLRRSVWQRWRLSPKVFFLSCLLLPTLPDADTLLHLWVDYGHPLGHRGIFHSFAFSLLLGFALSFWFRRKGWLNKQKGLWQLALILALLNFSHGLADTLTTGGKAPRVFWPLHTEGVFAPWRPIPVSPMGKSLLRTQWSQKQLERASDYRTRFLKRETKALWLSQALVRAVDRPEHVRRLMLLGAMLTEILYLLPFLLLFWFWDRRMGAHLPLPPVAENTRKEMGRMALNAKALSQPCLALILLCLIALGVVNSRVEGGGQSYSVSRAQLDDEYETPYIHITPDTPNNRPVALLLHGWRCSKEMMKPLAKVLASHGIESFAVDFPGHGDSPKVLDLTCSESRLTRRGTPCRQPYDFTAMAAPMLRALFAKYNLASREVVLIGHSAGGIAAYDIAESQVGTLRGRIALEGRMQEERRGGNRLVIGGVNYFSRFFSGVNQLEQGAVENNTAYAHQALPVAHLDLLYSQSVQQKIFDWFRKTTNFQSSFAGGSDYNNILYSAGLWLLLFASLSSLIYLQCSSRFDLPVFDSVVGSPFGWRLIGLVLGAYAASLMTGELGSDGPTWLRNTYYLCAPTYLGFASLLLGLPFLWSQRKLLRIEFTQVLKAFGLGTLIFILIYFSFYAGFYQSFLHTKLNSIRFGKFFLWALMLLPLTCYLAHFYIDSEKAFLAPLSVVTRLGSSCLFLWIYAVGCRGSRSEEVLGLMLAPILVEVFSWVPTVFHRNRWTYALSLALTWSWLLTVLYPYVVARSI